MGCSSNKSLKTKEGNDLASQRNSTEVKKQNQINLNENVNIQIFNKQNKYTFNSNEKEDDENKKKKKEEEEKKRR